MRRSLSGALIGAALGCATMPSAVAGQVVAIAGGKVQGATDGAVTSFKGLPYAGPALGANRWKAPQPVIPWQGIRDATRFGKDCAQTVTLFPTSGPAPQDNFSEDCLFANVWRPAGASAASKLPVIVWIYGGALVSGASSNPVQSGAAFARDGVIAVNFNYRVGRLGFFAHPALAAEGFGGNFGFLDQIAALRWVRDNIAAFGGDPEQVTVFGQSAGGYSTLMMLQSPLARGLFSRAIVMSGGGRTGILKLPSLAEGAAAGDKFFPGLTAAELRALPAEKIVLPPMTAATKEVSDRVHEMFPGAMEDGRTLLGAAVDAAAAGLTPSVPVIIGTTSGDGYPLELVKDENFAGYGALAEEARKVYDPNGSGNAVTLAIATNADRMIIEPARGFARARARRGQPTWLYRFDVVNPRYQDLSKVNPAWSGSWGGAPHAADVPFVFDTLAARRFEQIAPNEQAAASLMHRYWVNFAKTGKPDGAGGVPDWPQVTAEGTTLQFIDAKGADHREDPYTPRLDVAERWARQK